MHLNEVKLTLQDTFKCQTQIVDKNKTCYHWWKYKHWKFSEFVEYAKIIVIGGGLRSMEL